MAIQNRFLQFYAKPIPKHQLDGYDRRILEALQKNGRLSNVELAEQIGLSPSPAPGAHAGGRGRDPGL